MTPVRVLLVNDHLGYDGGVMHGVTRYFLNVVPRLDPRRVEASVCFLRQPHPASDELRARGVEPTFLERKRLDPRVLNDLIALVRERAIDVLHLAGMKSCLFGRIAARRTHCAAIIHLHDTQRLGRALGWCQRRLARWTAAALAVSEPVRELALGDFGIAPDRAFTLHNGIPIDEFSQVSSDAARRARAELNISPAARVVGMVGRISAEKGHRALIEAFPRVVERCADALLLVVGDGPLRADIESLVRARRLDAHVRFAGYRADVPVLLAALDVLAMPSTREGLPYSALEAMAAGRPVVAYAVGGLPSIVEHGRSGMLVEPGRIDQFVDAIADMLQRGDLADGVRESCRRRADLFSIERHVRQLETLYASVARSTASLLAALVPVRAGSESSPS